MSYWYTRDWNNVAHLSDPGFVSTYARDAVLQRVEYGTRGSSGVSRESAPLATPPAKVSFTYDSRCVTPATCATHDRTNWPETPWDLDCQSSSCPNSLTPSFWSQWRPKSIITSTYSGSLLNYDPVDTWDFTYVYPTTGSSLAPALWLDKIKHTGNVGGTLADPEIYFHGRKDNNRADFDPNAQMAAHWKYRIDDIYTESGGRISVTYGDVSQDANCQFGGTFPNPDNNSSRCFPKWYVNPSGDGGFSWWHKFMVAKVAKRDWTGAGSPDVEHAYTYSNEGASSSVMWTHQDGPSVWTTLGERRSYNDWRGYSTVLETTGVTSGTHSKTKTLYFRGLDKSMTDAGETARNATITNTLGEVTPDSKQFAGMAHEVQTFDGAQVITKSIADPTSILTGTRTLSSTWAWPTTFKSFIVRTAKSRELTWLASSGTWRTTQIDNTFNSYGLPTQVVDSGDTAISTDNSCEYTSYVTPDTTNWRIDYPWQVHSTNCAASPGANDYLSGTQFVYDGLAMGVAPTLGNVTKTHKILTTALPTWWPQASRATHDSFGRVLDSFDALDRKTTTAYTQTAGTLSQVTVTNAAGHITTTALDRNRGLPLTITDANNKVTTAQYDPSGRVRKVWKDHRSTATTPNVEYVYTLQSGAPSHVRTRTLGPNGNQIDSYTIYDGLMRTRQTQTTTETGMRAVSDTQYDNRGLQAKVSTFYNGASAPTSTLLAFADTDIDRQLRYVYDGAERQTAEELFRANVLQHRTATQHDGDRIGVIPPTGGTPTLDLYDGRGRAVERRQYSGTPFTGAFDKTSYAFDLEGQLTGTTDPAGNQWIYTYDTLGRKTQTIDPDAGTSSATYDIADQTLSTTDARGTVLAYAYDSLGRKTGVYEGTTGGTRRSGWVYDSVAKGQLTSTSRYDGATTYTSAIGSYDDGYRPLSTTVTAPGFGAAGATLTYTTTNTYKANGSPATTALPSVGGLPAETTTTTYSDTGYSQSVASGLATYLSDVDYLFDGLISQQLLGASGKRIKQAYTYDAATRRVTNQTVSTENQTTPGTYDTKYSTDYGYDPAGNVLSAAGKTNAVADQQECFQYDNLQRMNQAWTQTSGACAIPQRTGTDPYWRIWTFDSIGNRLTQLDKNTTAGDTTWLYTNGSAGGVKAHQVKQITATGPLSGTPTRTFGYDPAGNTTSRTTDTGAAQTLTWDKEGHLATATQGAFTYSYVYDTSGSRVVGRDSTGNTLYLPDGTEIKVLTGGLIDGTRHYTSGSAPLAVRKGNAVTWVCSDRNGTATIQIDATTLAAQRQRSMPYGENRGTPAGGWIGTKGYVGGTKDNTGLTHIGAREYDPTTGRFISRDPVIDNNDPQQLHGYAYSNNSPITFADPDGLRSDEVAAGRMTNSQASSYNSNYKYQSQAKNAVKVQNAQRAQRERERQARAAFEAKHARAIAKDVASAAGDTMDSAHKIATGVATQRLKARDASRHATDRQDINWGRNTGKLVKRWPWLKTVGEFGNKPWVKGLGRATIVGGFVLDVAGNLNDGDQGATAVAKAGLEAGLSAAGAGAGAAIGAGCGVYAVVCVPVLAAVGGFAGDKAGGWINGKLESGAFGVKPYEWLDRQFDWD